MSVAIVPEDRPGYAATSRESTMRRGSRLAGASDVFRYCSGLALERVEHFVAIALDVRHRVLQKRTLAIGSLCGVEVHPRDVFRPLVVDSAASVIFVHNHPSGDVQPSRQDIELTQRLRDVGDLMGIPVLDHVIIGGDGWTSLAERNWR